MSFAVVLEGMSVVSYLIILSGGKRLRESGWRVLSLLVVLSVIVQAGSVSIVVSVPLICILQSAYRGALTEES